jgi:hypothetical protein
MRWVTASVGLAAAAYATYVGVTWYPYGARNPSRDEESDALFRSSGRRGRSRPAAARRSAGGRTEARSSWRRSQDTSWPIR